MPLLIGCPIAALLGAPATAHARLGESEARIELRYGKPIAQVPAVPGDLGLTKYYASKGFSIFVTFLEGRSVREMFAKRDRSELSAGELQILLNADSGGYQWGGEHPANQDGAPRGASEWRSIDQRTRVAFYDTNTRALFITTQDYIDRLDAHVKQIDSAVKGDGNPQKSMPSKQADTLRP